MLYACDSLSCSRLCRAWCPLQACGCVVTSDAYEALFRCNHLGRIAMMSVASCIPFPFSAPCDDMLAMLVCATRWLYMHLYTLAYMSMHESCLLVCRPCFHTMKLWKFDPNLHLSLADTTFCSFSCLFVFHLFACFPVMLAMSITLIFFYVFSYTLCIFPSIACLLVSCFCLCMYTHGERTHEARA